MSASSFCLFSMRLKRRRHLAFPFLRLEADFLPSLPLFPFASMAIHSPQGKLQLAPFHIGTLVVPSASLLPTESATAPEVKTIDPIFLNKKKWKKTKLIAMDKISHDTIIYKFELESPEQRLGLVRLLFLSAFHFDDEIFELTLVFLVYSFSSPSATTSSSEVVQRREEISSNELTLPSRESRKPESSICW